MAGLKIDKTSVVVTGDVQTTDISEIRLYSQGAGSWNVAISVMIEIEDTDGTSTIRKEFTASVPAGSVEDAINNVLLPAAKTLVKNRASKG
jgi:hypothetical protein